MEKALRLYTVAFGDKYLEWFKRALLPSLYFKKNRDAIQKAHWVIVTDKEEAYELASELFPEMTIECYYPRTAEQDIQTEIESCLRKNAQLLMCPPDTVFANGTIPNLINAGAQYRSVVGMPHVRVNPSFLEGMPIMASSQLVSHAWAHLHDSWKFSEVAEYTNSYIGGVSWRKIAPRLIAVQHRLPTPYLVNFKPSDLEYFQHEEFNVWDHEWPSKLVNEERFRYIGSSDAAFAVEITERDLNCAVPQYTNPEEPDAFCRDQSHNKFNRQVLSILRSESDL